MNLDAQQILTDMTEAARRSFEHDWPLARTYVETEFTSYVHTLGMIAQLLEHEAITPERAVMHLDFQRRGMEAVLLTVQGLGVLVVENAINAAIAAVRQSVNTVVGFPLL